MGWFVWIIESALCLAASYAAAVAVYPDRSVLDRFILAMVVDTGLILLAIHLCGLADRLSAGPLALVATLLCAAVLLAARRATKPGVFAECLRNDLRAPARLVADTVREREVAVGTLVPAALAAATCALMVWYYRSWTWDPVWYHVPKTSLVIQEGSLRWLQIPNIWTQGNPANLELLAVWNCIFPRDNRFDDSAQLPFLIVGAAVVAAWCRRVGASRPLSAALGAVWIALPPIFLQAHSTHADVAWNSLFTAAIYFTLGKPERRDRWVGFLCWGLFIGMKYTGLFHIALWGPWLLGRAVVEVANTPPGKRLGRTLDVAASGLFAIALGCFKYVQNWRHARNPMWPFDVTIRSLGLHFHGESNPGVEYGSGPDVSPTFFGAPNALHELVTSWFNDHPFYAPDVRSGRGGPPVARPLRGEPPVGQAPHGLWELHPLALRQRPGSARHQPRAGRHRHRRAAGRGTVLVRIRVRAWSRGRERRGRGVVVRVTGVLAPDVMLRAREGIHLRCAARPAAGGAPARGDPGAHPVARRGRAHRPRFWAAPRRARRAAHEPGRSVAHHWSRARGLHALVVARGPRGFRLRQRISTQLRLSCVGRGTPRRAPRRSDTMGIHRAH